MWPIITVVSVGIAIALSSMWMVAIGTRQEHQNIEVRLTQLCIPIVLVVLYLVTVSGMVLIPYQDYNVSRLVPSVALIHGYQPYPSPDKGPIFCNLYGPVNLLFFLPAGLALTPNGSIAIGAFVNAGIVLVPLLAIQIHCNRNRLDGNMWALLGFCLAVGALLSSRGGYDICIATHADAPAVGFGLLSCIPLMKRASSPRWSHLAVSASAAILAMWTKQVEAPVIAALAIYVGFAYGKTCLYRFGICVLAAGLVTTVGFIGFFGLNDLWLNLVVIPSRHPWWASGVKVLAWILVDILKISWPFALMVAVGLLVAWKSKTEDKRNLQRFLRDESWCLPLLVAVIMIPLSVLGRAKMGSWEAAYHSLYYLICAASLVLVRLSDRGHSGSLSRAFSCIALAMMIIFTALCIPKLSNIVLLLEIDRSPQQQAYEMALKNPGELYFPWNPLSTLMAEGKLYNTEPGILDLKWAGMMPSQEQFERHVPAGIKYVAYQKARPHEVVIGMLPQFNRRVHLPELPGWIVYSRERSKKARGWQRSELASFQGGRPEPQSTEPTTVSFLLLT